MTLLERLTGMVWWPRNRDPRIKGPQPRLITIEQAEAMERHRKEMEDVEGLRGSGTPSKTRLN